MHVNGDQGRKALEILKAHVSPNANSVYDPIYKLLKQLLALGTKSVPSQGLAAEQFSQLIKCRVRTGYEFMPPENYCPQNRSCWHGSLGHLQGQRAPGG